MANASDLVSRVILPSTDTNIPHSCVRVTPQGPVKAGIDYVVSPAPQMRDVFVKSFIAEFLQVQLTLNSTDIYWWYMTLHYKSHMVGYVGTLYGSTFSVVKSSGNPKSNRVGWFKISLTKATMLDDGDDYR